MNFVLSQHAADVMRERDIKQEWLDAALVSPALRQPHETDPALSYALLPIAERDGRVLPVVYKHTIEPWKVVTVYFDRTMKGRL
ncbi:MAG: DUF4258 domain-containing protein [Rhodocyclaceae bacterium]|jgi:hypothetical protein|nr:DUF4258 domain-containing protein [Rhodocyclaceae bacterium]MCZ7655257.1 DUF4258 domain-containing protein [Rhodocyclaceae bacterium]